MKFVTTFSHFLLLSIQCSMMTAQMLQGMLYRPVTVKERWWDEAKFANFSFQGKTPSRILCAGKCHNHAECDMFSLDGDSSLCHLGTSLMPTTFDTSEAQNSGLVRVYSEPPEMCEHEEGTNDYIAQINNVPQDLIFKEMNAHLKWLMSKHTVNYTRLKMGRSLLMNVTVLIQVQPFGLVLMSKLKRLLCLIEGVIIY